MKGERVKSNLFHKILVSELEGGSWFDMLKFAPEKKKKKKKFNKSKVHTAQN